MSASSPKRPPPTSSKKDPHQEDQLPSIRLGHMTAAEEASKRRKTCRFLEEAGRVLKLPRVAVSTAMVLFHRFYAQHSFQDHDRFEVAVACILLAAKTEESPRKLKDVLIESHKLKTRGLQHSKQGGGSGPSTPSPTSSSQGGVTLDPKGQDFAKLKERILLLERILLHTIGFELSIDHPYKFCVEQVQKWMHHRSLVADSNPKQLKHQLVQYCICLLYTSPSPRD